MLLSLAWPAEELITTRALAVLMDTISYGALSPRNVLN
eukprot:CAMPEP_0174745912 /NCGR_PEP_ID=MMETSP1094-20130205/87861_1 /TAXON_ID=156173 /ORGANISM="Chrysochromulina brevifilum, Strain UTEX LB 985" /LENGTH=37 /DNA_ID= /DNA_START= /DNA_END= /DNA_ORIENTATION=